MKVRGQSMNEQLQGVVAAYRAAGELWPADTATVAEWAIRRRMWDVRPEKQVQRLARLLARAMREESFKDPQGRRVRLKHAYPDLRIGPSGEIKQHVIWEDMPRMTDEQMLGASQLRRQQVLGDCHQLKTDIDSFNDNYNTNDPINMSFDFTEDLIEREMPTKYDGFDGEDAGD